jgi:hypothetical protein
MKPHVFVIAALSLTALSGCFMSKVPRVETGTLFARGPVAFCSPDEEKCQIGYPSGDEYVVEAEDTEEQDIHMRFEPLTEADGVPVYLGEIELREDDEAAWVYLVARPSGGFLNEAPRYEIIMPGCRDLASDREAEFSIVRADAYTCTVTDLAVFRTYLITDYADRFANNAWWAGED